MTCGVWGDVWGVGMEVDCSRGNDRCLLIDILIAEAVIKIYFSFGLGGDGAYVGTTDGRTDRQTGVRREEGGLQIGE